MHKPIFMPAFFATKIFIAGATAILAFIHSLTRLSLLI
jgi:hypothetical protein